MLLTRRTRLLHIIADADTLLVAVGDKLEEGSIPGSDFAGLSVGPKCTRCVQMAPVRLKQENAADWCKIAQQTCHQAIKLQAKTSAPGLIKRWAVEITESSFSARRLPGDKLPYCAPTSSTFAADVNHFTHTSWLAGFGVKNPEN